MEVRRLCEFLEVDLDAKTQADIVDMCSFEKMSKEKDEKAKSRSFHEAFKFYRKGNIIGIPSVLCSCSRVN